MAKKLRSLSKSGKAVYSDRAKSTKQRCLNPTAYGCKTCRMHGARRNSSIKRGEQHPNYLHGMETLSAKHARQLKLRYLRAIEADLLSKGLIKR